MRIAQSASQKKLVHYASEAVRQKTLALKEQLSADKERSLREVLASICEYQGRSEAIPPRLQMKKARLERELEEMEEQAEEDAVEPDFADDVAFEPRGGGKKPFRPRREKKRGAGLGAGLASDDDEGEGEDDMEEEEDVDDELDRDERERGYTDDDGGHWGY